MFSLIISIIAIALVAALAGASVYYGGSAFNKGTAGADASTLINGGQQVNGAVALANNAGASWSTVGDLVSSGYLSQAPSFKGTSFTVDSTNSGYVEVASSNITDAVCLAVNARTGDTTGTVPTSAPTGLYGCYNNGTSNQFDFAAK